MPGQINPSQPIRICFIAPKAYPLFNADAPGVIGGAELDLYYLATELAKDKNFAITFITADYGQQQFEAVENVKLIKSLNFRKNPLIGAVKLWRALSAADAKIYMIKTISAGTFLTALFCRLKIKIFLYRTAHTTHCDGTYLSRHPLKGRLYTWALKTAKIVFTQNQTDKDSLKRTTGTDSIVIPNGHQLTVPDESKRDTILWVGRSAGFKRPQLFIKLAETMKHENFTLICQQATGDSDYQSLISRAKQVKNLKFIERVPFHQIDKYFQSAKLLVNTSDAEGFPNTFIQACKAAVPILSFNVNPDGFLDQYSCGRCADDNWEKFIEHFNFLTHPQNNRLYGENAKNYAQKKHDIKKIADEYKKILTNL